MNGWTDGWIVGEIDGWMDKEMDGSFSGSASFISRACHQADSVIVCFQISWMTFLPYFYSWCSQIPEEPKTSNRKAMSSIWSLHRKLFSNNSQDFILFDIIDFIRFYLILLGFIWYYDHNSTFYLETQAVSLAFILSLLTFSWIWQAYLIIN